MNSKDSTIILKPGEIWDPWQRKVVMESIERHEKEDTEKKLKPEDCKYHDFVDVVLFRTTVRECRKCGKLDE